MMNKRTTLVIFNVYSSYVQWYAIQWDCTIVQCLQYFSSYNGSLCTTVYILFTSPVYRLQVHRFTHLVEWSLPPGQLPT